MEKWKKNCRKIKVKTNYTIFELAIVDLISF